MSGNEIALTIPFFLNIFSKTKLPKSQPFANGWLLLYSFNNLYYSLRPHIGQYSISIPLMNTGKLLMPMLISSVLLLEDLCDYTAKHFNDEEQYMESINYKKLFTQKIQHQEFIHKLDEFTEHHNDEIKDQDEQIMGILKYLTEWLVNHILYVDGQIAEFVSKM